MRNRPIGVVGALAWGFDTATRQWMLMALPIALDLFLWIGPRFQSDVLESGAELAIALDAKTRLAARILTESWPGSLGPANWLGLLRLPLYGPPGLSGVFTGPPGGQSPPIIRLADAGWLAAVALATAVIGIGLGGLFWSLVARQVRDGRIDLAAAIGRMSTVWPRLIGLAGLTFGLLLGITLLASMAGAALSVVLQPAGILVVPLAVAAALACLYGLAFGVHGIVLYNQPVLASIRTSVWLGRTYPWPTLGVLGALIAIDAGMGLVWSLAPDDSWLWLVAIVGNAFVVAAASTASMIYYADRVPIPRSALVP